MGAREGDAERHEAVVGTVERWLGNPLSRKLLKLVTGKSNGESRLDKVLRCYVGEGDFSKLSWRDQLAFSIVKFFIDKGSESFGVSREVMMRAIKDPIVRKGIVNVLEGIEHFGVKRPFVGMAPFLIVWNYTRLCNLRCKHCYESASPDVDVSQELSTEERRAVVDELADAGVVAIAFSGGEPLMRKDVYEIAAHAKSRGFYVSLATNGTLISKEVARKIKEVFDYVEISLDGFQSTHDEFRGVNGAWKRTCEGIKNCVAEGIDTGVAVTVTRLNFYEFPSLMDFVADELGAKRMVVFNYVPVGKGKEIVEEDLSPQERWDLLRYLYSNLVSEDKKLITYSTAPQYAVVSYQAVYGPTVATHFTNEGMIKAMRGKTKALSEFLGGCGAGRLYLSLEPNGDVEPCVFLPIKIGNLKEQSLREIWCNSEVLKKLREREKFEGCGSCEHVYICGGCRARAYGYFGNIQGADPGCLHNLGYWEMVQGRRACSWR